MLIFAIIVAILCYFVVAVAYAIKLDNIFYYRGVELTQNQKLLYAFYVTFWIIFFVKLHKICEEK
jgi:hypothetical protein